MAGANPRPRAPGAYLRLALWQRFVLAAVVTAALLTAMVLYVNAHNTNSNPTLNEATEVRANREAEILVEQDQAPHSQRLALGLSAPAALERAIRARMSAQVTAGAIDGPVRQARCARGGRSSAGRSAFSCTVVVGEVTYPFLGVVDTRARRVTYCKRDPPPAPSDNVPVSPRCL